MIEHDCNTEHPGVSHFLWITTATKKADAEKASTLSIPDALKMGEDQVVLDFLDDPAFAQSYAAGMIEIDEDDLKHSSPAYDYRLKVDEATASITFEEVFLALVHSGKIWKVERDISSWRGDSNKFMCPSPTHDNPGAHTFSAWGSKEKGVWTCTKGCGKGYGGGDKFTLAEFLYDDQDFHRVAERLALDFRGVRKPEAKDVIAAPLQVREEEKEEPEHLKYLNRKPGNYPLTITTFNKDFDDTVISSKVVIVMPGDQKIEVPDDFAEWMGDGEDEHSSPTYSWRDVLALDPAGDTFLHRYCEEASHDTTPDEFNLFNGLIGIGLIVGNRVSSPDFTPLSPNFGIVLVADSGGGKTRSVSHIRNILSIIEPEGRGTGVKFVSSPASGQMLVRSFIHEEPDPVSGMPVRFPVKGVILYDEFSELATQTGALGSIIKEKLHAFIDHARVVEYSSMGSGRMISEGSFASVITATQPGRFKDLLTKSDAASGFINRFLFIMGTPKPQRARGAVALDWTGCIESLKAIRSKYSSVKSLDWSFEANTYFEGLFHTRIEKLKSYDKKDILTRLDLNIKRMILAFAINDRADEIQLHHVKMAEALLSYIVKCYGGVITRIVTSKKNTVVDWCHVRIAALELLNYNKRKAEWIEAGSQGEFNPGSYGVTIAMLKREYRSKGWEDDEVKRAIDFLKNTDMIHGVEGIGKRGPKTVYYHASEAPDASI